MIELMLLKKLRCPISGAELRMKGDQLVSVNRDMPYRYNIENGIPILLKEKAIQLSDSEWKAVMNSINE
jgi:uncharacterized protein YbaR (Trm112 family)